MLPSYTRYRRYAQFQSENPDTVFNGADLDGDYDRIKVVFDAVVAALADVRRDDGGVKNVSIGVDQLKTEALALLSGVTPRGSWATATVYAKCDLVRQDNVLYFAIAPHTSGVFATDLAANVWMAISAATNGSSVGNVPAGSIAAMTVQDALNELDAEKQPLDGTLTALAGVTTAANKLIYATGADTFSVTDFTVVARALLDDTTFEEMLVTLGALPKDGSVGMTGALTLPGAPTAAMHAATKEYVDTRASARSSPIRQTVIGGPVDGTTGLPSLLPATGASLNFSSQSVTSSVPFVACAANGYGAAGVVDSFGYSSVNLTWTGLTASRAAATPNFLYALLNADGTLTTGKTLLAPIYQWGGVPGTASGQFTFNIGEMKGYLGNGSTAAQANVVFVGEAATDGTGVISTVTYAYNSRYDSGYSGDLPATNTAAAKSHNLGVYPRVVDFIIECTSTEGGYAVGDQLSLGSIHNYDGANVRLPSLSRTPKSMSVISSAWIVVDKATSVATVLTASKWKYKLTADRGW